MTARHMTTDFVTLTGMVCRGKVNKNSLVIHLGTYRSLIIVKRVKVIIGSSDMDAR